MKVKKRVSFMIVLLLIAALLCISAYAEKQSDTVTVENLQTASGSVGTINWNLDDAGTLTVTGSGAMSDYSYFTYGPWSDYSSSIKRVVIGNGVTRVGGFCFVSCTNLTSVELSSTVESIGSNAFYGCTKLGSVNYNEGLVTIESGAFNACHGFTSLSFPSTLREIGASAFYYNKNLYTLNLNNGLLTIGSGAFKDCDNLASVTIPDSVTEIADNAFSYCDRLTRVTLGCGAEKVGNYSFEKCIALKYVVIPDGVKDIGHCTFAECSALDSITLPEGLETIESYAFEESALKSIIIPNSVRTIDSYAFQNCDALEDVTIGNGIETMNRYAFAKCDNLKKATLTEGLSLLGARAFYECPTLSEINFPDSLRSIGECCFSYDTSLTNMTLNEGLEVIEYSAFSGCTNLVSIYIPKSVTSMATQIFTRTESVTVYCVENSAAHSYAVENSLNYELITTEPTVSVNSAEITVANLIGIRDLFIAKGYFDNYTLVNLNKIVRITETKLAGESEYTYILPGSGEYTVLIRYNDGTQKFLYAEVDVTEPTFTENGLQLNIANLEGIKVIRTAIGEHKSAASIKRTEGARAFTVKDVLKGKDNYTVQYREEGVYTVAVCYENGYTVYYKYNVVKKSPEMTQNGNRITFTNLYDLKVIRYAKGEYTSSGDIKRAQGSVALTANKAVNGSITVTLSKGIYTFCVQYNDESYNYYTVVIE